MSNLGKEFKEVKIIPAIFWYIFTMFIVIVFAFVTQNKTLITNDNLLSLISSTLFFIVILYKFRISKDKVRFLFNDYLKKFNYKEIFGVVVTQLFLSMGISLLIVGCVYFLYPNILNNLLEESSVENYSTYSGLVVAMIITVILAPLCEELLFRAIIFKRLSKIFNIYVGIIISSLVFGLLHIELAIIGAFLFGLACCILYVKYKNILIPMTVHFLNNLLAFLPQLDLNNSTNSSTLSQTDALTSLIFGIVLFAIGMFFFIKFIIKNKSYLKNGFDCKNNQTFEKSY